MKRKICYVLFLVLLVALVATLFACKPTPEQPAAPTVAEEQKTILFLGDSIGEAIAGTAPLTEREAFGYYGILGNINGFEYYNRAVTGYTTDDLAKFVKREDDGVNMVRSLITDADVIHISIIGNDFLNSNHAQMMIDLSENVYDRVITRRQTAMRNLEEIFSTIRSLNPDALIITQTLYNPTGENSPLINSYARSVLASKGIQPDGYHALMDKMIHAINRILYDYVEEHTTVDENGKQVPPFELVDVYSAFEKVYTEDYERWKGLFALDGVHTHPEGHALVAELLQDKFAELGLTAPDSLYNYKRDKVRQLNRLYADLENKKEVRDAIMRATTFHEVSTAYFDGTRGVVPRYTQTPVREGNHFNETKTFEISLLKVGEYGLTAFLDQENAKIVFSDNGEYTLYAPLSAFAVALAKTMINQGGFDADDYFPFDLAHYYFADIVPGIEQNDLRGLLDGIRELYGIEIVGIDYDSPAMQEVFERHRETYELIITDASAFGSEIAIKCTGTYVLNTVTAANGESYTAIYVNDLIGKGESYVRYTCSTDEETEEESVRMTIDVIRLEVEGILVEEE